MRDRQHQDTLARQEEANREMIAALGQVARDVEAPPDFVARVLARADRQPAPRPGRLAWLRRRPLGHLPWGLEAADAAVFVLAVVGAVPQYTEWFNTYVRGIPAEPEESFVPLRTRGLGHGAAASMPLGTWEVNAGGDRGPLQLVSVSYQGELRGTLLGTEIVGFWDERAQQVTFVRLLNPVDPSTVQLFTGYLFRTAGGLRGVGTATYTLAGSFTALPGTDATAARAVYGWYAQQAVTE
jgi:hypothetical protein